MRALIVGAGAVGQVFAYHLARGGAEVTLLVKEKYAEAARRGFALYSLRGRRAAQPRRLVGAGVITAATLAASTSWDQVYITVDTTALGQGTWLEELRRATGSATVVSLQPGLGGNDRLAPLAAEGRLVTGMISFLSYAAPLAGEPGFSEPGVAYWFPPFGPSPFSGPAARTASVVAALRAGGLPATRRGDVARDAAFPSAVLLVLVAALEGAGWSFAAVRQGDWLRLARRAAAEAVAIASRESGARPPFARRFVRPLWIRAAMRLAAWLLPFDVERYLQVHFTKVAAQMRLGMRTFIEVGARAGLSVGALRELQGRVG